jgi:hypothetical protein
MTPQEAKKRAEAYFRHLKSELLSDIGLNVSNKKIHFFAYGIDSAELRLRFDDLSGGDIRRQKYIILHALELEIEKLKESVRLAMKQTPECFSPPEALSARSSAIFFAYSPATEELVQLLKDAYLKTDGECDLYDEALGGRNHLIWFSFLSGG